MQYSLPAQASLKGIKHHKFKDFLIIVQWNTPFVIVVFDHSRIIARPVAGVTIQFC
jgi:hypothetical protein